MVLFCLPNPNIKFVNNVLRLSNQRSFLTFSEFCSYKLIWNDYEQNIAKKHWPAEHEIPANWFHMESKGIVIS